MNFSDYLKGQRRSAATIVTYSKYTNVFTAWLEMECIPETAIGYTELLDFIRKLQQESKSSSLINDYLCAVRHYFNYLVVTGKRTDNPASGVYMRDVTRRLPHNLLSAEELSQLYVAYRLQLRVEPSKKVMLGLLIWQGVAVEELKRLHAEDIYLHEGKVFIAGSSHSNERWLPLEPRQVLDLADYIKKRKSKSGPLLAVSRKGKVSANNIVCQVSSMMRQLRRLNPKVTDTYQLRNSVLAIWVKQHNLRKAQYMAGHRYASSTARYIVTDMGDLQHALRQHHPLK